MTGGNRRRQPVWLAGGAIAGLLLGFVAGSAIHRAGGWPAVVGVFDVFGTIWGNALRMVVMPLVVAQLMYTVISPRGSGSVGRIGTITVVTFLGMLLLGGFATVAAMPILLGQLQLTPEALTAQHA